MLQRFLTIIGDNMKKFSNNSLLKKVSVQRIASLIILLAIFLSSSFLIPNSNDISEINSDRDILPQTPLLANNNPILFEGNANTLNITDYGNLYEYDQEVSLTNQEELNLTYYLDDVHDWEVSEVETKIRNIQDTKNWVESNEFDHMNLTKNTVYQVYETSHNYANNEDKSDTLQTINEIGAIAIRVHFDTFEFEDSYDFCFIEDENNTLVYQDTEFIYDFFSPWVRGDTLQLYIETDGTGREYGYYIDYYEYVTGNSSLSPWSINNAAISETYYGYGFAGSSPAMFTELIGTIDPSDGYWVDYEEDDIVQIYQELNVPRGTVLDASLSFNYFAQEAIDTNDFTIFAAIDGQKIYSLAFGDVVDLGRNTWHTTGNINMGLWVNSSIIFDKTLYENSINVSVGIKSGNSASFGGYDDRYQQVIWFSNISLILTTTANSTQSAINLRINDNSMSDYDTWGISNLTLYNNWDSNPLTLSFLTDSSSLTFDLNTTLFGYHETTSKIGQTSNQGVFYQILENGTILWEFSHNFYMPAQYSDFEFIIDKPENWNFISVLDPTLQSRPYEYGGEGDKTLQINKENAIFPGWWTFKATSPNFLNISNTKLLKQGQWTHTSFTTGESTIIKTQVNFSNEVPFNLGSTEVNLTVFDPEGNQWYSEVKSPLSNGSVFFSELSFGALNTTGGQYDYTLFWSNGTSLGGLNSSFLVIHESSFSLSKPNDAISDAITDAFVGDIIPVRVNLKDSENNDSISNAIISYNWTSGTVYFEEAALGIYETILDTSNLGSNGFYEILIESSKVGFLDYNLTLKINLGEETNVQRLQSDYSIELHANSTIKFRYYSLLDDDGINGANVGVNISNPDYYSIENSGDGYYDIEFDTSFTDNLGIHQLNFNFSAPSFEPQTHIYQFEIVEQSVNITAYVDNIEIQQNSIIDITYMEEINISTQARALIDGNLLTGGNFTWKINTYEHSFEYSNFWYNTSIQINPSIYSPGLNLIGIQFEMEKYQTDIFYFQLLVYEQPANLSIFINSQPILENEIFEIMYMESISISVKAFATIEADFINGASIRWQGGSQNKVLTEVGADWYNTSIQIVPSNYTPGLNSIAIEFVKDNYQNKIFYFQLLVEEQSVDVSVFVNSQLILENDIHEIMYMESISISVKAFATIEAEYIDGALITWQGGSQQRTLIELGADWYNTSIQIVPSNYTPGLNSIAIEFVKDNYQNEIFHFQLLVNEQSVNLSLYLNSHHISEDQLVEVMFKQDITISAKAYGNIDLNYIGEAYISWSSDSYAKNFIEYGANWYNLSLTLSSTNFSSGINTVSIKFEKQNYTTIYFSFQLLVREQSIQLNASINNQIIAENALIEVMFKENITIAAQVYAMGEGIYLSGGNITLMGEMFSFEFNENISYLTWFTTNIIIDGAYFDLGINTVSIKFEQDNYSVAYFSFQFYITAETVNLSLYVDSQEIATNSLIEVIYYDEFFLSLRALANVEKIFLDGGSVIFAIGSYNQDFTQTANYWYNMSITCDLSNFDLGINSVYVRFLHPNYTSSTFYFQILVNQIEMNVVTIDFQDSIETISGESIVIRINLTELISASYIENTTISYSWEFGLGNFEEVGNGIYELELVIPDNIQGSFKVSLIISTENVLYKSTQSSFLLVIGEPEFPMFIIWIILVISAAIISVLGILSLRSYVILPRKRKKEAELLSRTQRFKDIQNIQAIVAIHRYSGIPLYSQSYSILEKHKKELFSGFVQAIITVGEEMVQKDGSVIESGEEDGTRTILELDFKYFYCLICDREDLRLIFLLNERASDRLKKLISDLSMGIMLDLSELIENWDGAIHEYEAKLPPIIAKYVELYYKNPFKINDAKFIAKLRKESELNSMETRLLNVMYSITKSKAEFYLERIFEVVHEKNQDLIIDAIETLLDKQIIIPSNK